MAKKKKKKTKDQSPKKRRAQSPPKLAIVDGLGASAETLLTGAAPLTPSLPEHVQNLHTATSERRFVGVCAALAALKDSGELAQLDTCDSWGRTPLFVACRRGDPSIVALLLSHGADQTRPTRGGETPLGVTAWKFMSITARTPGPEKRGVGNEDKRRYVEIARMLLAHGDALKEDLEVTPRGDTLLHRLVQCADASMLEIILENDAFYWRTQDRAFDDTLGSVWNMATVEARDVMKQSVKMRASPRKKVSKESVLEMVTNSNGAKVRVMFEAYPELDEYLSARFGTRQECLLSVAASGGNLSTLVNLLKMGAADLPDRYGYTALGRAAEAGHLAAVRLLLSMPQVHSALRDDPSLRVTVNEETCLHTAVHSGSVNTVALLAMWPGLVDRLAKNKQGNTAKDLTMDIALRSACDAHQREYATLRTPAPPAGDTLFPVDIEAPGCSVCFMPPPTAEDELFYCVCKTPMCHECLRNQIDSARKDGLFPCCWNECCATPIPFAQMKHLTAREQCEMLSVVINMELSSSGVYAAESLSQCFACNRHNPVIDQVMDAKSPKYTCGHCGVNVCFICRAPWCSDPRDRELHARCVDVFPVVMLRETFEDVLMSRPGCPSCGISGTKDDACTHCSCECGSSWCYVCGAPEPHGSSCDQFQTNAEMCPMYLEQLDFIDSRVKMACHPLGICSECDQYREATGADPEASVKPCRVARENAAGAILDTIRVRIKILTFAAKIGMEKFIMMLELFCMKETLDINYFGQRFPWSSRNVPSWESFEPEDCREFYRARQRWFIRTEVAQSP